MEVDDALKKISFCGRWQAFLYSLNLIFIKTQCIWNMISIVWIGHKPPHHCKIPANSSVEQWIPLDASGKLSSCSIFVNSSNQTTACVNGWTFDDADSGPTVVTKFNLVCDRTYLLQSCQMALTIGLTMGIISTKFSDMLGRKWVLLINNILMSLFSLLTPFCYSLELFFAGRFLIGIFLGGTIMSQLVYLSESFSKENRDFYTVIGSAYWGVAAAILPPIAYLISNWVYLQLVIGIYGFIILPFLIWWLPETVPWLHANNRIEEAEKVMSRAYKMNKVAFTKPILKPLEVEEYNGNNDCVFKNKSVEETINQLSLKHNTYLKLKKRFIKKTKKNSNNLSTQCSILDLVRNRFLRRHMTLAIILFIDNFGYYGVTYMSGSLAVNRFWSGFLGAIVEVPGCFLAYIAINKFGRKYPVIIMHIIAAISIFVCILTVTDEEEKNSPLYYAALACNTIFKFLMSGAYAVVFIYGIELFPTNLRNQAIGFCLCFARFGSIIASFSSYVIELYPRALYACFGCMTLLGGLLTMLLPETSNKNLPETLQEIETWYDKSDQRLAQEDNDD